MVVALYPSPPYYSYVHVRPKIKLLGFHVSRPAVQASCVWNSDLRTVGSCMSAKKGRERYICIDRPPNHNPNPKIKSAKEAN
jgi:hypothetical protein